ncbi:MAG: rod shape-determining protein MreD, partial [Pseudomonadota bacterium]
IVFVGLLPLDVSTTSIPGPDIILLLCLVWILRRPDYAPVGLIAGVTLIADFLFMRPPGLWTLIVVLGTEFVRTRETGWRDVPYLVEWLMAAILITVMSLAHAIVLAIFIVPQPAIGATLIQIIMTIICYPIASAILGRALGIQKRAPGEPDALGHRQ